MDIEGGTIVSGDTNNLLRMNKRKPTVDTNPNHSSVSFNKSLSPSKKNYSSLKDTQNSLSRKIWSIIIEISDANQMHSSSNLDEMKKKKWLQMKMNML